MTLTAKGFAVGMAPVYVLWPKETPPDETLDVYYRLCQHLPDDVFVPAVVLVLSAHTFGFPKPGDILDAAVQVVMAQQQLSEGWARQTLDDYRRQAAQLDAPAQRQIP